MQKNTNPRYQVTVLLAVRNEENHIEACLQSLDRQEFDKENFEVLIGNDFSEDETAQIVRKFIADKPNFKLFDITTQLNNLKGKPNVLAQLSNYANAEWLVFTDADMVLPKKWLQGLLKTERTKVHFTEKNTQAKAYATVEKIGIVTGFTTVAWQDETEWESRWWAAWQACDWTYYLGVVHFFSCLGLPLTAMGNNMAVSQLAYTQAGGYENLSFSLTEDYALFRKIISQGFGFQQLANSSVLAYTQPVQTIKQFFAQRQRWTVEFRNFVWWTKLGIYWQSLQLLLWILLGYCQLVWGICAAAFHCLGVWLLLVFYLLKTKQFALLLFVPLYVGTQPLVSAVLCWRLFGKQKVEWKGRVY